MVDKSPRPKKRPDESKPKFVDAVFKGDRGSVLTAPDENNPITMLGLTEGDIFREEPELKYNARGLYFKRSDDAEGGPVLFKNGTKLFPTERPGAEPFQLGDVVLYGEEGLNPQTAAHEFMHRGFEKIRTDYTPEQVSKRFGEDVANLLYDERPIYEHALLQGVFEKEGITSHNTYVENLDEDSQDRLNRTVSAVYELANESIGERGFQTDRDRGPTRRPKRNVPEPSFFQKIKKLIKFNEGGMVEDEKHMGFQEQMDEIFVPTFESTPQTDEERVKSTLGRRPGFRSFGEAKGQVSQEELLAGVDNAASFLVPFYDAGVNVSNVVQEYMKPEDERDYDYINGELGKAGMSAALEAGTMLAGLGALKYGGKAVSALADKIKQYEFDPNTMSAFGVGSVRKKDTFEEVMTPVKTTKDGFKKEGEAILRPSEDLASDLDPRLNRAMAAETAGSVMPGPGKFFDPSKKGYKGDRFVGMLRDADIELDLEFGNYIMMGKGKPQDVSNKTFENLFVSARPSQKRTTFGKNNKSVARANTYDGPELSVADMKANYKASTGKTGPEVRTNLLQPERFKVVTDEGDRLLDHPIVAVETKGTGGQHFYTLDTQFVGPVRMDRLTQKVNRKNPRTGEIKKEVPQPNLRPATVGDVQLGDQIGTIRVGKKEHPFYDYIEVDATMSAPEGMGSVQKFNEGGMAMNDQMRMAFMSEGGVPDNTVGVDPVSGNEIPLGSSAEEVRDDIPAMLSEGEYVVPADVVKYYGVKFFEDLRTGAKLGLQDMAENGRIGGEPVEEEPSFVEEEDLAELEQMLLTGAAKGGLMDKIAHTAKNDPVINKILNSKGASVGFAEGGLAQSRYGSSTEADQLIGKVLDTVRKNPNLERELSSRGININRTAPQMNAQTMDKDNPPAEMRKAFADGGSVSQSGILAPSTMDPMYNILGGSYTYAGAPSPNLDFLRNTVDPVCPEGFVFDKEQGMCVPIQDEVVKDAEPSRSDDNGAPKVDPNASDWIDNINWADPTSNYDPFTKDKAKGLRLLSRAAGAAAGPLGVAISAFPAVKGLQDVAQMRAMEQVYRAAGMADEADVLKGDIDKYISSSTNLVDNLDGILATGNRYKKDILKSFGLDETATPEDIRSHLIRERSGRDVVNGVYRPRGVDVSMVSADPSKQTDQEKRAVKESRKRANSAKEAMKRAQASLKSKKVDTSTKEGLRELRKEYEKAGGTWATGGRYKGGLMMKSKKKK